MSRPVYIAAHALVCAAGQTAGEVADSLWAGKTPATRRTVGENSYPYYTLALPEDDWTARARHAVSLLAGQLPAMRPDLPVFIASSSQQIGRFEQTPGIAELPRGAASFSREVMSWLDLGGPHYNFGNACISGFSALEAAHLLIADGLIDEALVLGIELANRSTLAGFGAMQLLSWTGCRPFDAQRDGLVLGEALAAVHLGARPAGWRIAAVRTGLDRWSPTSPDPSGAPIAQLADECLQMAGLPAAAIDLVKLQAAGSPTTDVAEARALQRIFSPAMPSLLSLKPSLGHTLGASGISELSALLACLERDQIPATPGFSELDPEILLQPTVVGRRQAVQHAMLNLIGFGGGLGNLIVSRR
jgi:3-oxoacyl-[acyl-carrier-protein] synthase I